MRVLAFDTVSPTPALAILPAEGTAPRVEGLRPGSTEGLASRVRALLASAGADLVSLDRIGVLSGPGSFTGLRSGLAFARGLARALGTPLHLVPTFAAASAAVPDPSDLDFHLDAGRGEVHVARRRRRPGGETVLEVGPAPLARGSALEAARRERVSVHDLDREPLPLAESLARIVAYVPAQAATPPPGPLYGRPSAAEERWGEGGRP